MARFRWYLVLGSQWNLGPNLPLYIVLHLFNALFQDDQSVFNLESHGEAQMVSSCSKRVRLGRLFSDKLDATCTFCTA
jgi:hypothetical protein